MPVTLETFGLAGVSPASCIVESATVRAALIAGLDLALAGKGWGPYGSLCWSPASPCLQCACAGEASAWLVASALGQFLARVRGAGSALPRPTCHVSASDALVPRQRPSVMLSWRGNRSASGACALIPCLVSAVVLLYSSPLSHPCQRERQDCQHSLSQRRCCHYYSERLVNINSVS